MWLRWRASCLRQLKISNKSYKEYSKSIQKKWDSDVPAFIDRADTVWASIND